MPMPVSRIGVNYPRRARRVRIVQHDLKSAVVICSAFIGPITEKACWCVVLANAVRHPGKNSVVGTLVPIDTPVELVVFGRARALRVIVLTETCTGHIRKRV